jgi:hypothetical protein
MAPDRHSDPIIRDLQAIRRLHWSKPEEFGSLETLLAHPLIAHFAFQPKNERQRVKVLRAALREVVDRIRRREGDEPPLGRSVAEAATALLRLTPEFEEMSLEKIRKRIAGDWSRRGGGGSLSPDGFRLHLEVTQVYEPLAREFRLFVEEQAEDYSPSEGLGEIEPADDEDDSGIEEIPTSESVAEALRGMELVLYRKRRKEIDEGVLRIRSEDEMLGVLRSLTKNANREYHAVDYVQVSEWFGSRKLHHYLEEQLDRVEKEGLKLARVRLVRPEELQYERSREQLEDLMKIHAQAGGSARLLLCREKAVEDLRLSFAPHAGLLMIDRATAPAAVTGKLSGDGAIGRARVYIGETKDLQTLIEEYEELEAEALKQDAEVRAEVRRLQ